MPTACLTVGRRVDVNGWIGTVTSIRMSWVDVLIAGSVFRVNVAEVWSVEPAVLA